MELPALITSDLHLTANPRDEYRWALFPFLADRCRAEEVKSLLILGDLTDAKDYHPASLVNRVVAVLRDLPQVQVYILQGNHDYLQRGQAFFSFLNHFPNIKFITSPTDTVDTDGPLTMFLPHTRTPAKDWQEMDLRDFAYVFMHQTVGGAVASNGQKMEDEGVPIIKGPKVYSGDIHVPQIIKGVEYVGSPYHVHFGDNFKPRCVLIDRWNKPHDLHFKALRRVSRKTSLWHLQAAISDLEPGDQLKLELLISPEDKHEWQRLRRIVTTAVDKAGVELCGLSMKIDAAGEPGVVKLSHDLLQRPDKEVVCSYVEQEGLGGDALDTGLEVVR